MKAEDQVPITLRCFVCLAEREILIPRERMDLNNEDTDLRVRPPNVTIYKLSYLDHSYPLRGEKISEAITTEIAPSKRSALLLLSTRGYDGSLMYDGSLIVSTEEAW